MAKATKAKATKATKPASEGSRYRRAAAILVKDETISVEDLANKGFMSMSVARACKEAWAAVTEALKEAGRLKTPPKVKPVVSNDEVVS